jgi:hypothetical protein
MLKDDDSFTKQEQTRNLRLRTVRDSVSAKIISVRFEALTTVPMG